MKSCLLVLFPIVVFLVSCAETSKQPVLRHVEIFKNGQIELPDVDQLSPKLSVKQVLEIDRNGNKRSLEVLFKNTGEVLSVTGVSSWGMELFFISYSNRSLRVRKSKMVPTDFRPEYAMADILIATAPIENLRKWLKGLAIKVSESSKKRVISIGGIPKITVEYDSKNVWSGQIKYTHLERKYQILIRNLEVVKL